MTLAELNAMPREAVERELQRCCGSARWVAGMIRRRPFKDIQQLRHAADEVWWSLGGGDWLEAFSGHPRIGDRTVGWASQEQAGTRGASIDTLSALGERNHEYARKFGHVFLICATGKSADEMLSQIERRMANDPATELRIAAGEQAKITRLRLEKLLSASATTPRAE